MADTALPTLLQTALAQAVAAVGERGLKTAAGAVSARYRAEAGHAAGAAEYLAYAATRMPATYAASVLALDALAEAVPGFAPASLLDLAAGPGTVGWAAIERFPTLDSIRFIERAQGFATLGRRLAAAATGSLAGAEWVALDLETDRLPPLRADLVTLGYALGELTPPTRDRVVDFAWQATTGALVLIEPGTPAGTARILAARDRLRQRGVALAAPCPHDQACPLATLDPWCHFEARLPRTPTHRRLKGGDLGFEDEKFAYLVLSRAPVIKPPARVLFPPRAGKTGIEVTLCQNDGLAARRTISSRDRTRHAQARRWRWGDAVADVP